MPTPYNGPVLQNHPGQPYSGEVLPSPPKPQTRSLGQDVKRQLGLTGRTLIEGATAIPMLVGDAANAAINLGSTGINKLTGANIPMLESASGAMGRTLNAAGFPQPETGLERIVNVGSSAATGAGLANLLSRAAKSAPRMVSSAVDFLADAPMLQTAGAISGAGATEGARAAGIEDPAALTAIGVVGSITPGTGMTGAARTAGGAVQAVKPFTAPGREVLAGKALNRLATNPEEAANRLAKADQIIPGSAPTVGQASGDAGLAGADQTVRSLDTRNRIGERLSEQNTARTTQLDNIARDEATLAKATQKRDSTYETIAEVAFKGKKPLEIGREPANNPALRKIEDIRYSTAGARQSVQKALDFAEGLLKQERVDITDVENLYSIRKDLAFARDGKLSGDRSDLKLAKRELSEVIKEIDNLIESAAPGYQDYLKLYSQRSVPLDQLKAIQTIREKAVLTASDAATGDPVISNAKFQNLLRNNLDRGLELRKLMSIPQRDGTLKTNNQLATLDRIASDLDRAAAPTSANVRQPGSSTFKNMSVASVLGRVLGDATGELLNESSWVRTLTAPLNFLYRIPEDEIQTLILDAWLDPKLASTLMKKATQSEIESLATELGKKAAAQSAASALYGQ